MGRAKDIWGFSGLTRLMIPASLLTEATHKYIRLTKWCNPVDRIRTAEGEVYFGKWMENEVRRISRNKHREAWVMRHREDDNLAAVVVDRPKGLTEWPEIYEEDGD